MLEESGELYALARVSGSDGLSSFYSLQNSKWRREFYGREEAIASILKLEEGGMTDPKDDGEDVHRSSGQHVSLDVLICWAE